jgi:hypothetical protein
MIINLHLSSFLIQAAVAKLQANIASMEGVPVKQTVRVTAKANAYFTSFPGHSLASMPNSLIEITMDSSDFTTSGIPDSVFAIPEDYKEGAPRALRSAEDIRRFKSWRWWRG